MHCLLYLALLIHADSPFPFIRGSFTSNNSAAAAAAAAAATAGRQRFRNNENGGVSVDDNIGDRTTPSSSSDDDIRGIFLPRVSSNENNIDVGANDDQRSSGSSRPTMNNNNASQFMRAIRVELRPSGGFRLSTMSIARPQQAHVPITSTSTASTTSNSNPTV